jgi:esterase
MPHLEVGGTHLHYQVIGEGKPVVLLHGLCLGDLSTWYFIAVRYLRQGYRVILYDMRGHGRSDAASSGFDLETLTRDLAGVLDGLAVRGKVSIGGFSYGGLVALAFALKFPRRIEQLALVETPLPPSNLKQMYEAFYEKDLTEMLEGLPPGLKASMRSGSGKVAKTLSRVSNLMENTTMMEDVSTEPALQVEELNQVDFPVACIYAKESLCHADGVYLHKQIPGSIWYEINTTTHYLLDESGAEVGSVIRGFLDK